MKINKFLKIIKKDPLLTTIVGGVIVSLISIFIQNKLNLTKVLDIIVSILNFKIPIWMLALVLVLAILRIKCLKNKLDFDSEKLIEKQTTQNVNTEVAIDSENFIETITLNKKILSYTEDTFEGIRFKWEYKVVSSGYIIYNIKPICEICNSVLDVTQEVFYNNEYWEKHELESVETHLTCPDCCFKEDENLGVYLNQDAIKMYTPETYDLILNSIKPNIKAHLAVLRNQ